MKSASSDASRSAPRAISIGWPSRLGQPIDIARGALLLASDEADFITGHELVVDGGLTLRT